MDAYDPLHAPDAEEWLATDESERLFLVLDHHGEAGVELPNEQLHATIHVIVENQIAEGYEAVVSALARLIGEGLDRHEAIHAIGCVLAEFLVDLMSGNTDGGADANERYFAELEKLTVAVWRERFE